MSKVHYFSIILSLFFLFTFSNDIIAKDNIAQADSVIVINPFPLPGNDIPRSPELVPISASYDSFFGAVILSFSSNLGEIEVEVLNTTNGYYDSGHIQTWPLSAIIPISGGPGHYIITFTLPSWQQYQGEFDV